MNKHPSLLLAALVLQSVASAPLSAVISADLSPSFPSPANVGDTVIWTATGAGSAPGELTYRFRVRRAGEEFRTVIDYGPDNTFAWTPADREGGYEIEVSVRNPGTGETAAVSRPYLASSRVTTGRPVISQTGHPFVLLYSAPACPVGSSMWVQFQSDERDFTFTPAQACTGSTSMNFYLAGMRTGTQYWAQHVVSGSQGVETGPVMACRIDPFEEYFARYELMRPPREGTSHEVLLQSTTLTQNAVATDLNGNLLWFYGRPLVFLTRAEYGGTFFGIQQEFGGAGPRRQIVREFDLTGTTLRETNAARINEQLAAMGRRTITSFHHEAGGLPGDRMLVLASTEQILNDVQGPGPVNVIGEMILVLDPNLQVEWTWDAFEHLDVRHAAVLDEKCRGGGGAGCPPYSLTSDANDWLHANSVTLTPDGNLLMSIRHLDLVIKIDYQNGHGSGRVIWRLGKGGDFQIEGAASDAWFSHQHDAVMYSGSVTMLSLFDNGNTRFQADPDTVSRGQLWALDEVNRTATPVLNIPLSVYAPALGSAQRLSGGGFSFGIGWVDGSGSRSVELDPAGNLLYGIDSGALAYRIFRMKNLYTP